MIQTRTVTLEIPIPQLTLEHGLWGLVALAIAADLITTQLGLANGLVESNPAARGALEYGTLGFLAMKGGAVALAATLRLAVPRSERWIPPACLAAVWLGAALWNAHLLARVGVLA